MYPWGMSLILQRNVRIWSITAYLHHECLKSMVHGLRHYYHSVIPGPEHLVATQNTEWTHNVLHNRSNSLSIVPSCVRVDSGESGVPSIELHKGRARIGTWCWVKALKSIYFLEVGLLQNYRRFHGGIKKILEVVLWVRRLCSRIIIYMFHHPITLILFHEVVDGPIAAVDIQRNKYRIVD